jgi:hypothetical protein
MGKGDLLEGYVAPIKVAGPLELRALDEESCLQEVDRLFPKGREPHNLLSLHLSGSFEICADVVHRHLLEELGFGLDRTHRCGNRSTRGPRDHTNLMGERMREGERGGRAAGDVSRRERDSHSHSCSCHSHREL